MAAFKSTDRHAAADGICDLWGWGQDAPTSKPGNRRDGRLPGFGMCVFTHAQLAEVIPTSG